jgi:hypothetical protein
MPKFNTRVISNFFENLRKYSQVKVFHQYQRHRGKFCHWYRWCRWYRWQICRRYLPPGSTKPAARIIMRIISVCSHLKVNLKEKMYLYVNSTAHRFPNKTIKTCLTEDFSHLPPESMTPVAHIELRISRNSKRP